MHRYVILSQDVTFEGLQQVFGEHLYPLYPGAWAAGSGMTTSSEISSTLGFEPGQKNGIVLKVGEYYGCYNEALWQKLEAWREQP